ncbi:MAG: NCS1 family nucleobase:cation symporter-1 [Sulfolobales archaeon]
MKRYRENSFMRLDIARGQIELLKEFRDEHYLWNIDIHPTPIEKRTWGAATFFWIWVSMVFIIPSWTLASVGIFYGLDPIMSVAMVFLGNLIVLVPMIIQSHGGARYGIAEPQLTRTRWGIYGANLPSILRAIIGAGWWGIETYIITEAAVGIYTIVQGKTEILRELVQKYPLEYPFMFSKTFPEIFWTTFAIVVIAQILVFYFSPVIKAQPVLKWLARLGGPIVLIGYLYTWIYFMNQVNWSVDVFILSPEKKADALSMLAFLNANIAFWATMALTMPDYTRFARSQWDQAIGQIPMPFLMGGLAMIAVMTTAASKILYGAPIWDPIILVSLYMTSPASIFVLLVFILSTFLVNVFANAVGPAYDIANIFPKKLSWFKGSLVVVVISILLGAWTYYGNAYSYLFGWLLTYGGLLGSVEGIIIFDYVVIRRFKLDLPDIYMSNGIYRYWRGINPAALITFIVVSLLIYVPEPYNPWQSIIFPNAWIFSFVASGAIYIPLMVLWVIPKYQSKLKGSLLRGYVSKEVEEIFAK